MFEPELESMSRPELEQLQLERLQATLTRVSRGGRLLMSWTSMWRML